MHTRAHTDPQELARMATPLPRLVAAVTVPVVLLAACGGPSKDADGAKDAVEDYLEAISDGDEDACDMETKRFREETNDSWEEGIDCPERIREQRAFLVLFELDVDKADYEAEVDGDRATVTVTFEDGEEVYGLVWEDGRWLVDSEGEDSADEGEDELSEEEADATAAAWLSAWCDVQIGMTRDEAIAVMGEPTSEYGVEDDSDPQLNWSLGPYDFTAFLDTDDVVTSFHGDYDSLGESDLAQLPCVGEGEYGLERTDDEPEKVPTVTPTAAIGEVVSVGVWDVEVTKLVKNADEILADPDLYNSKPRHQYVLVTYRATYNGEERKADVAFDLTWTFTSSSSKVFDTSFATTPADDREWPGEARPGGTVRQQVVFDVPADQISGGTLTVEAYDDNFDEIVVDFPVG